MANLLCCISEELAAIVARVRPSLVQIRHGPAGNPGGAAAGTIWHPEGLIVTNAHVVAGPWGRGDGPLEVVLADGHVLPARILAQDAGLDLAALRVSAHDLPAIPLADSRRLRPGEMVLSLGFPWGVTGGATVGVVIDTGSALPELAHSGREWVAASLHLRPGHSGGPMLDSRGRLVGLNTLMNGPGVGVAVPTHVAVAFLKAHLGRSPAAPLPAVV